MAKRLLITLSVLLIASTSASARSHRLTHKWGHYLAWRHMHHHHHHHYQFARRHRHHQDPVRYGVVRRQLDNGKIVVVSAAWGDRLVGFLNDLFHQEGRLPEVGCYAAHGHMPLPWGRHPAGEACDVGQQSRNVAWKVMYHIGDLARSWGLVDGASWHNPDAGHVQVDRRVTATMVPALMALRIRKHPLVRYASGAPL